VQFAGALALTGGGVAGAAAGGTAAATRGAAGGDGAATTGITATDDDADGDADGDDDESSGLAPDPAGAAPGRLSVANGSGWFWGRREPSLPCVESPLPGRPLAWGTGPMLIDLPELPAQLAILSQIPGMTNKISK